VKIALLLYFPRSGSTFFASLAARHCDDLLVVPELRLPLLLVSRDPLPGQATRDYLLDLVREDYQFAATGLDQSDVERSIERMPVYSAENFLLALAETMAAKTGANPAWVMYKCGAVAHWWPALPGKLPNTRLVHVYRDGRGAVCSAINTERPYRPGSAMGRGDAWEQAGRWRDYMQTLERIAARHDSLYEIRYEKLCERPQREIASFAKAFALSATDPESGTFSVASAERAIHANIDRPALAERIDAWKTELKPWQGLVCEIRCAPQLEHRGYEALFAAQGNGWSRALGLIRGYIDHLRASGRFYLRQLRSACLEPRRAMNRFRLRSKQRRLRG
jgi:hypothetical protein